MHFSENVSRFSGKDSIRCKSPVFASMLNAKGGHCCIPVVRYMYMYNEREIDLSYCTLGEFAFRLEIKKTLSNSYFLHNIMYAK